MTYVCMYAVGLKLFHLSHKIQPCINNYQSISRASYVFVCNCVKQLSRTQNVGKFTRGVKAHTKTGNSRYDEIMFAT